jgi:hypothetical protein
MNDSANRPCFVIVIHSKSFTFVHLAVADRALMILFFQQPVVLFHRDSVATYQITISLIISDGAPRSHAITIVPRLSNFPPSVVLSILISHARFAPRTFTKFSIRMVPIIIQWLRLTALHANFSDYVHTKLTPLVSRCNPFGYTRLAPVFHLH